MDDAIRIAGLHKSFGHVHALDGLDLQVRTGEVHGFLGPNGAGKSTTIRILLGLLRADDGTVRLLGGDPWHDVASLHRRLAYVPGDVDLWPNLTGGEVIDLLGRLRGGLDESRRAELLERFALDPTKKGRQYSKGNRQKVALVAALAADVELFILDEPTSGLDPLMEAEFRRVIEEERERGAPCCCPATSSPRSKRCATGSASSATGATSSPGRSATCVTSRGRRSRPSSPSRRPGSMHRSSTTSTSRARGSTSTSTPTPSTRPCELLTRCGVRSMVSQPPTLEELFLRHYAGNGDTAAEAASVR